MPLRHRSQLEAIGLIGPGYTIRQKTELETFRSTKGQVALSFEGHRLEDFTLQATSGSQVEGYPLLLMTFMGS